MISIHSAIWTFAQRFEIPETGPFSFRKNEHVRSEFLSQRWCQPLKTHFCESPNPYINTVCSKFL